MTACKLCSSECKTFFNINLQALSICDNCANSILTQQASALIDESKNKNDSTFRGMQAMIAICKATGGKLRIEYTPPIQTKVRKREIPENCNIILNGKMNTA